ncbi:MAG: TonB-dependent receptor [Thermoanaerobaculia bacterium]|nr:TonB-dependent receptor [Thermoanaerobaculia bacterium]
MSDMSTRSELWKITTLFLALSLFFAGFAFPALGQTDENSDAEEAETTEQDEAEEYEYGEAIVVVGSRSAEPRSVIDSPVPIDVISDEDFNALGNTADLTDNLKALVPSYTATPATGDGSAFVRPTSLRGTAPDQTLVLINGKRRHRSALVQFFAPAAGNGAHGVDVGMIPGMAIRRVEVLRDGAAAQYGSDAIAGVINFALRDSSDGAEVQLQYGQHYEGEESLKAGVNAGFSLPNNGFFNLTLEHTDNDALSRGVQRPDAQALIDSGVSGVGSDAPFGDEPLVQTWGRPETSGTRLFFNSGVLVGDNSQLYFHGGYAETEGRYRFFYRNPNHPSLVPLREQGFTGLPAGYTPFLDGDQTDLSLVAGLNGVFGNGTTYDFSVSYGENELDYFLNNTINQDLGLVGGQPAQRDFDVGGYQQEELNLNADFTRTLSDNLHFAYGFEWREETYVAVAGEPSSYQGAGSNGLKGISPTDAGSFSRDNVAVYADLEHDVSEKLLMQYAVRYEDFSDFGDTVNGKIATRYSVNPTFTLRAAVSTGFHAPTPGQANVRTTITTFDGVTGMQVEEGLVPSTSPLVAEVGGKELEEETSVNYSLGFTKTAREGRTSLTIDAYQIDVDDRIYRTGDIPVPGTTSQTISFYTNALDVESQGIDIVLSSGFDWAGSATTDFALAFSYNEIDIVGQTPVGGVLPVSEGIIEDIENNYPNERIVVSANTRFADDWSFLLRGNYYGKHFDERGRIGAATAPSFEIGATFYVDLELGLDLNESVRLAVGAINVFDEFVDEINAPFSNRQSVGLQYPRRSAANYEGGSWYVKTTFRF